MARYKDIAKELTWLSEGGQPERGANMQFINCSSKKASFLTLLHRGQGRICKRDTMNRRGGENHLPKPGGRGPGRGRAIGGCSDPAGQEGVS